MLDFILADQNIPFTVALAVMLCIAALEGVGTLLGLGFSSIIESAFPDVDMDVDGPDIESSTILSHFISWLRIGEVPFLILVIVFLTSFGILGLIMQKAVLGFTGTMLPGWLVSIPAFLFALPSVRTFGGIFAKLVPQDETEAVSEKSFVGRIATITLGTAQTGSPAEAKVTDEHQHTHYIMVEPDNEGESFAANTAVLIVRKSGSHYKVIANPNDSLV